MQYYLLNGGEGTICPGEGTTVSEDECLYAATSVCTKDFDIGDNPQLLNLSGFGGNIPCGCFLWEVKGEGQAYVAYNGDAVCNSGNEDAFLVCEKEVEPPNPFVFNGVVDLYSFSSGEGIIFWDPPTYYGQFDTLDFETVGYHIFITVGDYNFEEELETMRIDELGVVFDADADKQYHLVVGEIFDFEFNSTYLGEEHSILVTAEVVDDSSDLFGLESSNVLPSTVAVSAVTPKLFPWIEIKGIFVPTDLLNITLVPTDFIPAGNMDTGVLTFAGALLPDHENIVANDYISGFDNDAVAFLLRVDSVVTSSDTLVVLNVETGSMEDIYEELDIHSTVAMSRENDNMSIQPVRSRRLVEKTYHRRLGRFWNKIKKGFKKVTKFVADKVKGVVNFIKDVVTLIFTGKLEKNFNLFKVFKSFKVKLGQNSEWTGALGIRSDLKVYLKIPQLIARATVSMTYEMGTKLKFAKTNTLLKYYKRKQLWRGKRKVKVFFIGPVPVIIDYYPQLDMDTGAQITTKATAVAKVGFKGGTSLVLQYSGGSFSNSYNPPTFKPYYAFDFKLELGLDAYIDFIFKGYINVYAGLLSAKAGLRLGVGLDADVALFQIEPGIPREYVPVLENFDINLRFGIPIGIGSKLVKEEKWFPRKKKGSPQPFYEVYTKKWPIITLPDAKFKITDGYECELGTGPGGLNVASVGIEVESRGGKGWIRNKFRRNTVARWWVADALYYDWSITKTDKLEMSLSKVLTYGASFTPKGTIYAAVKPAFPPLLPLPVMYEVEVDKLLKGTSAVACLAPPAPTPAPTPSSTPSGGLTPTPYPTPAVSMMPVVPGSCQTAGQMWCVGAGFFETCVYDPYFELTTDNTLVSVAPGTKCCQVGCWVVLQYIADACPLNFD